MGGDEGAGGRQDITRIIRGQALTSPVERENEREIGCL
jgi:hypothetical protein